MQEVMDALGKVWTFSPLTGFLVLVGSRNENLCLHHFSPLSCNSRVKSSSCFVFFLQIQQFSFNPKLRVHLFAVQRIPFSML